MNWKLWIKAAAIRCIKTIAQAAIGVIGASYVLADIDWKVVVSASLVAGILSILTSLAGLPEVDNGERFTIESFDELSDGREEDE